MGRFSPVNYQFDTGPGIDIGAPFRALGDAMIARRERLQRQKQLDLENARRADMDTERKTTFELGMRREGYSPAPPDDPALKGTPQPMRVGNYAKTGLSDQEAERMRVEGRRAMLSQGLSDFQRTGDPTGLYTADPKEGADIYEGVMRGRMYDAEARGEGYFNRPQPAPRNGIRTTVVRNGKRMEVLFDGATGEEIRTLGQAPAPEGGAPKDDRATFIRQRYRENLNAKNPASGGIERLYQTPAEAMQATQAEADAMFGTSTVPVPPPASSMRGPGISIRGMVTPAGGPPAAVNRRGPRPGSGDGVINRPAPVQSRPVAGGAVEPDVDDRGGAPSPAPTRGAGVDIANEQATARAAIANGADPAKVRERFKQRTGRDLP